MWLQPWAVTAPSDGHPFYSRRRNNGTPLPSCEGVGGTSTHPAPGSTRREPRLGWLGLQHFAEKCPWLPAAVQSRMLGNGPMYFDANQ